MCMESRGSLKFMPFNERGGGSEEDETLRFCVKAWWCDLCPDECEHDPIY